MSETPYAGSSGWSGSTASRERAERDDATGTTAFRQATTLVALGAAGPYGMTWQELAAQQGWHHGQTSGALSVLHKAGSIARLTQQRNRCHVYVALRFVGNRAVEAHGRRDGRFERLVAGIRSHYPCTCDGSGRTCDRHTLEQLIAKARS